MKRLLLPILTVAGLAAPVLAEPLINSWYTDHSGAYARLYETTADESAQNAVTTWNRGQGVQTLPTYCGIHEISSTATHVYIRTTGLASHIMGPWYLNAAKTNLFPNYPANRAVLYEIARDPGTPPAGKTPTGLGAIGYFVDGVAMFDSRDAFSYDTSAGQDEEPNSGAGVNGDDIWNRDAFVNEMVTFDAANAHQAGSNHHYHANPPGLRHQLGDSVDYEPVTNTYTENFNGQHSPIIGWVRDSYPVYGPYGYDDPNDAASTVRRMISGYQKRDGTNGTTDLPTTGRTSLPAWAVDVQGIGPALAAGQYGPAVTAGAGSQYELGHYIEDYDFVGTGDLDLHGGRFCVTPEFPAGTYAYFTSIEADGTPVYPYNIGRTYYGNPTGTTVGSVPAGAVTHFEGGPEIVEQFKSSSVESPSGDVTVTWSAAEGGTYDVQSGPAPDGLVPLPTTTDAVGDTLSIVDAGRGLTDDKYFYRAGRLTLDPFDDTGFASGGGGTIVFTATFPTTPPLPPLNAVTSITVGGVVATIVSYDQTTGVVELDFDDSSLAPGFYNAVLTFSPGGTPTMVNSTNQYEVVDTSSAKNVLLMIVDDWAIDSSPIDNNTTLNPGTTFPTMANLQALAAGGVRFRNGYSQPVCSPMRAAILTGKQAWRTGVGNPGHVLLAAENTLPETFTAAGSPYALASFGKWHLGNDIGTANNGPADTGGWPHFVGITGGGVPNNPNGYVNWTKNTNGTTANSTTYSTTDQVNEAVSFIGAQGTDPWFVWMAFNAPHTPFHEPPAALLQGGTGTTDRELYEKALEALDTEIGRLLASVDLNKTNIILVGDNGTPNQVVQAPYGAGHSKGDIYEGGIHVPFVVRGPDVTLPAGSTSDRLVHVADLFPTILDMTGVALPGTGSDGTSILPILNGTDTANRCVVTEKFNNTSTFSNGDGRSIRMEADPAYPGSNPDYKLIIFANPFDTTDVPTYEFYDLVADENELSPLNLGALNATEQAAYDALIAKEATLGGAYNDPGTPFSGDTLYIQLPNPGGPPPVPPLTRMNGSAINVTSCTVTGATGTVTATVVGRFNSGAILADEIDDVADRYWVKVQVPADGPYTTAHVVFPDTPGGAAREYDSVSIQVKP